MEKIFFTNQTLTGSTKAPFEYMGETCIGADEGYVYGIEADSVENLIIGMTDLCIEAAKEGKPTAAYTNMWINGERVGVSVSFHNVCGEVIYIVAFNEENKLEEGFKRECTECVGWYMRKRGLFGNKSFNKKVMKSGSNFINEVGGFTNYYYHNTAA
jgi:hypothetical protein